MELTNILHIVGQALAVPCNVVLLLLIMISILQVGHVLAESFFECRHQKINSVRLAEQMQGQSLEEKKRILRQSRLYKKEKNILLELLGEENMSEDMRRAIAQKLLSEQEAGYGKILNITDTVAKLGPMFGLLGTLIPLGPGIVALGRGDTRTLSSSMEMAFDTTIAGIISAAVCSVLSGIRKRWYTRNMEMTELLMECVLQEEVH